jgi:3-keto-disaccharide hydrolase
MASEAGRRLLSSPPLESVFGNRADCSIREENMKRWSISAAASLLIGFAAIAYAHQASSQGAGWVALFDGKSLDGWEQLGDANWRVADGALVADKGNGFLVSKAAYGDFQIRAEFWVEDDSNSGIFIRCTDPAKVTAANAYEVNIWDKRPEPDYGTGAIVNIAKVNPMPKAAGKWNVYEITAKGDTLTVTLNGQKTVDGVKDAKHASGRVALQHGLGLKDDKGVANDKGVVKFRKVEIKPL